MNPLVELDQIPETARFLDARFRLGDAPAAAALFREEHIPGANFVELESELSGPKNGRNGRHPLPDRMELAALFSRLGLDRDTPVIAYDDTDHAGAAHLWLLLQWLGHEKVQVLHGGLAAWKRAGRPLEAGVGRAFPGKSYVGGEPRVQLVPREALSGRALVDARAPERYRGELEPIDPRAGHIPGAKNLFYKNLMNADGTFKAAEELRGLFRDEDPVFYCGSGVTASVLLLAARQLGKKASLYPGSWSEWCADPAASIETG